MKRTIVLLCALLLAAQAVSAKTPEEKLKDIEKRVRKLERNAGVDRIDWTGDFRVEAHSITGKIGDYYDGMALQRVMVNTMFFHDLTGNLPLNMDGTFNYDGDGGVLETIGDPDNYGAYMMFLGGLDYNTTFPEQMQSMLMDMAIALGMNPAVMTAADWAAVQSGAVNMMKMVDGVLTEGYDTDNDILYTTRLRLDMNAKPSDNVSFTGRLAMYKPWGASTQIPVFNGQSTTMAIDAGTPGVPGGETVRVERAYFNWKHIGGKNMYLSLGRRPSTAGPPLHFRQDEMRGGTPLGTIIDFQFDGATLGVNVGENTTIRACYGMGYESQYGNGSILKTPADRLKDASFFGFNVDLWNTDEMLVQATIARAFDITDGFNGYVILPNDPVTGMAMPGPIVTRFTPSANLGDFDLASALITRRDGPIDWFVSGSWCKSRPDNVTTPFGGLMSDPFETPEERTGSMYYLGGRCNLNEERTKIGFEWNHGSKYWFNFAPAQDDIIAPKTSARGNVYEGYVTHRINRRFIVKADYIAYDYDYSGSGWHLGTPKKLTETPILGFPTYDDAAKASLSFITRF